MIDSANIMPHFFRNWSVDFFLYVQPAPTLQDRNTRSQEMNTFIADCLQKDPKCRPSAALLLKKPFLKAELQSLEPRRALSCDVGLQSFSGKGMYVYDCHISKELGRV